MPTPSYITTCTQTIKLTETVWEIKLRMPEGESFAFKAGQFVLFDVPDVDHPDDIQPRAYSIGSPPSEDTELTFVIGYKEGGRASRWIDEMLRVGDTVRMQGPFGVFTVDRQSDRDQLFIGTGTGIVPFRSMILDQLEEGDQRSLHLFYGCRYEHDLFWVDELAALEKNNDQFHLHICLTQPDASWFGEKGRVTEVIPRVISDITKAQSYVCGNPEMVKDVKQWLLDLGVEKKNVHQEGYV